MQLAGPLKLGEVGDEEFWGGHRGTEGYLAGGNREPEINNEGCTHALQLKCKEGAPTTRCSQMNTSLTYGLCPGRTAVVHMLIRMYTCITLKRGLATKYRLAVVAQYDYTCTPELTKETFFGILTWVAMPPLM